MADVRKRLTNSGEVRWDVRYRDQARQQHKRSFRRKLDAERFARAVETDLLRGDWIDPRRGKEPFEVWAKQVAGDTGEPQAEDAGELRVDREPASPAALRLDAHRVDRLPVRARLRGKPAAGGASTPATAGDSPAGSSPTAPSHPTTASPAPSPCSTRSP